MKSCWHHNEIRSQRAKFSKISSDQKDMTLNSYNKLLKSPSHSISEGPILKFFGNKKCTVLSGP